MALHSLVFPVFNEEEGLAELYRRILGELVPTIQVNGDDYEVIFVDDGSSDRSFEILRTFHQKDPRRIRVLKFSRNFGHQTAITAGMDHAVGDTVTVMDADLQDPPKVVAEMIEAWKKGADVVYGVREKRLAESAFKKFTAHLFYRLLRNATGLAIPLDTGDFRLMSRRAIEAMKKLREHHRFVRGFAKWVGFKQATVMYVREARFAGETKYPLSKMMRLAWDGFTGFSLVPLRVATYIGLSASLVSLPVGLWALGIHFFTHRTVQGWTSMIIVVLFLGGIQLFCLGILGEYVGRTFEQSKHRPLYLIEEELKLAD